MIRYACSHCGQPAAAADDHTGLMVSCQGCGKWAAVPPPRTPRVRSPLALACWVALMALGLPLGVTGAVLGNPLDALRAVAFLVGALCFCVALERVTS